MTLELHTDRHSKSSRASDLTSGTPGGGEQNVMALIKTGSWFVSTKIVRSMVRVGLMEQPSRNQPDFLGVFFQLEFPSGRSPRMGVDVEEFQSMASAPFEPDPESRADDLGDPLVETQEVLLVLEVGRQLSGLEESPGHPGPVSGGGQARQVIEEGYEVLARGSGEPGTQVSVVEPLGADFHHEGGPVEDDVDEDRLLDDFLE